MKGGSYVKDKKSGELKRVAQTAPREEVAATIHGDKPLSAEGKDAAAALVDAADKTLTEDQPRTGGKSGRKH